MNIILGILMIGAGVWMVVQTEKMLENFGRSGVFEKYLGSEGGSRLGYKLLGLLIIFLGIVIMLGMTSNFLGFVLGPLLKHIPN